jgi:hypothetical protein
LSHTKLVHGTEGCGYQQFMVLVIPSRAGVQQSLRGRGLEGWGSWQDVDLAWPKRQGFQLGFAPMRPKEAGILAGHGSGHPTWSWGQQSLRVKGMRSMGPGGAWIQHSLRGEGTGRAWMWHSARAWHSLRGRDPGGGGAWIRCGTLARCSPRGGEPCRAEQRLCRPTGGYLAGHCSFIRLWCGEAFHDLRV